MARRSKKTGTAEDVVELLALLPWWGCLLIACAGYVVLHHIASLPLTVFSGKPAELGNIFSRSLVHAFASAGQFIVPLLGVLAAGTSAYRRQHRSRLFVQAGTSADHAVLDDITWGDFELLVGEAYRRKGYDVDERGGSSPDGGVDLVLRKKGAKYFVQCKQWKAFKVGVDVVRQLKGVMATDGARGGFVITSGRFTAEAIAFARKSQVVLVDGVELHAMIRNVRPAIGTRAAPEIDDKPSCPKCEQPMARRLARQGSSFGREFWGCSDYPHCRGTRPLT